MKSSEVCLYAVLTVWTLWFLYLFGFPQYVSRTYERISNTFDVWAMHVAELPGWASRKRKRISNILEEWSGNLFRLWEWMSQIYDHTYEADHVWVQDALTALSSPHHEHIMPGDFPGELTTRQKWEATRKD